jgi:2,3-bisphosphoglycerate-independent phosphoglycerate mutase
VVSHAPSILVILDGASEPVQAEELTSLERATTPVLDALAQLGTLHRLATTPPGLPAGSETGCAVLLGWQPPGPVDRALLEAAARGIPVAEGEVAWRLDVRAADGARADAATAAEVARAARARVGVEAARIDHLAGHRLLITGTPAAVAAAADVVEGAAPAVDRWPTGVRVPRRLDARTVVIGAPGAVTGLAALLGAEVIQPEGITGAVDEHLGPLGEAALDALHAGTATRVVVHVGSPDEAAHARDPRAKLAAIEAADEELFVPLVAALHELGGVLEVAIDHGCDPHTAAHDAAPTPCLRWDATADTPPDDDAELDPRDIDLDAPGRTSGLDPEDLPLMALPKRRATATARTGRRLTERWVQPLPVEDPLTVLSTPAARG